MSDDVLDAAGSDFELAPDDAISDDCEVLDDDAIDAAVDALRVELDDVDPVSFDAEPRSESTDEPTTSRAGANDPLEPAGPRHPCCSASASDVDAMKVKLEDIHALPCASTRQGDPVPVHDVDMSIPTTKVVLHADVVLEVRSDGDEPRVSKGTIDSVPANAKIPIRLTWEHLGPPGHMHGGAQRLRAVRNRRASAALELTPNVTTRSV